MKLREIIHDDYDIDQSLAKTFVTLFINPKKVIDNPGDYMKPWHYATYVVTISSLLFWTVIHLLGDPTENHMIWALPDRVLRLTNGYVHFYENTQPLKRLLLGAIAFYVGIQIAFYGQRKYLFTISLYLIGQSVFLVFIVQSLRMVILGGGVLNSGDSITGILTHTIYLSYAVVNVFAPRWWIFIVKLILVVIIYYGLYTTISSMGLHALYYRLLNQDENFYNPRPNSTPLTSTILLNDQSSQSTAKHHSVVSSDSLQFEIQWMAPMGEVSYASVSAFSKDVLVPRWSTTIFQKVDRYSPDSTGVFLRLDSIHQSVIVCYRISKNQNAHIRVASIDVRTGALKYQKDIDIKADDLTVNDFTVDSTGIYICGSANNLYGKFGLGLLILLDPVKGDVVASRFLGETSFSSVTSLNKMMLKGDSLKLSASRNYKRLMYFPTVEWFTISMAKRELLY